MLDNNNIKHILIPRLDTFGDIILAEGLIEGVAARFPNAQITLLVRSGYDQLSSLFQPSLRWMTTDLHPYRSFDEIDLTVVSDLLARLNKSTWDLLVLSTFDRTWIDEIIAAGITCEHKVAFGTEMHHRKLIHSIADSVHIRPDIILEGPVAVDEAAHETAKYQVLANYLFNDTTSLPRPRLYVTNGFKKSADDVRKDLNLVGQNYFVCLPGGLQNNPIKGWPLERYADLIAWIYNEYHYQTLLIGHADESALLNDIKMLVSARGIEPMIWQGKDGQIPLLASLIENASLFTGNDSGPMHIAATLGVPTIGIFGGGNYKRFLPSGDKALGVIGEMPCFGCRWDCIFGDAPCVRLVAVGDIKKAVTDIMSTARTKNNMYSSSNKLTKETCDLIVLAKDKHSSLKSFYSDKLENCESDRARRLNVIHEQAERILNLDISVNKLTSEQQFLYQKLKESEDDRAARLVIINDLQNKWQESEADRTARLEVINDISAKLQQTDMLYSRLNIQLADSQTQLEIERTTNLDLSSEIESMKRSLSWRLTAQLRRIAAYFRIIK